MTFSNLVTRLQCLMQCEVHFKIFHKKLSYDPSVIFIMCYNIWGTNFSYMACYKKERWWQTIIKFELKRGWRLIFWKKEKIKRKKERSKMSMTWFYEIMMDLTWPNEDMAEFIVKNLSIIYYYILVIYISIEYLTDFHF